MEQEAAGQGQGRRTLMYVLFDWSNLWPLKASTCATQAAPTVLVAGWERRSGGGSFRGHVADALAPLCGEGGAEEQVAKAATLSMGERRRLNRRVDVPRAAGTRPKCAEVAQLSIYVLALTFVTLPTDRSTSFVRL